MENVHLSKSGYFLLEKKSGKKFIKNFYKSDYTTGEKYFYIKANHINLEKLEKYLCPEYIDKSCYLFQLNENLKESNLSRATKDIYFAINLSLLNTLNKTPDKITDKDIEKFLSILKRRGKSNSTLGVAYTALKYFYQHLLKAIDFKNIKRPTLSIPVSGTLSRHEIHKIINTISNIKHKLLIEVAYGCGLRLQETVKLKVNDIDFKNKTIIVRKNQRKVPIPNSLLTKLKKYLKNREEGYLFYSDSNIHKHLTPRAAEDIFKKALKNSGINRNLSFKSLRDSFVVHMIEKDVNPEVLRKILGLKKNQFENKYKLYFKFSSQLPDLLIFEE